MRRLLQPKNRITGCIGGWVFVNLPEGEVQEGRRHASRNTNLFSQNILELFFVAQQNDQVSE